MFIGLGFWVCVGSVWDVVVMVRVRERGWNGWSVFMMEVWGGGW